MNMILFTFPSHDYLGDHLRNLCALGRGESAVRRFPNQELYVTLETRVRGEDCSILGSVGPPEEHMVAFSLLAHTLKKQGAHVVTAVLPYLAYSRHDKDKPGESLAVAWLGSLFRSSGIDEVITVDLHSQRAEQFLGLSMKSISSAPLFAEQIELHDLRDATLVAPDHGAIRRCREVQAAAGMTGDILSFEKERTLLGISHTGWKGEVGERALVIDDMLDTGSTLVSACERLKVGGAREIFIMVTHGLFTGSQWMKLWELNVKTIFCTDTVPIPAGVRSQPVETLSIVPLVAPMLRQEANRYAERIR
jgi:ribose-phosphate pyrophosphokinase